MTWVESDDTSTVTVCEYRASLLLLFVLEQAFNSVPHYSSTHLFSADLWYDQAACLGELCFYSLVTMYNTCNNV